MKTIILQLSTLLLGASLIACSGDSSEQKGGSSHNTVNSSHMATDYTPQGENTRAENSQALYLKPSFAFQSHQSVDVNVSLLDADNNGIHNVLIAVYSVPNDIDHWTDEHHNDKDLVYTAMTNSLGQVTASIELPQIQSNMLVEVRSIGIDNKKLIAISDGELTAVFQE